MTERDYVCLNTMIDGNTLICMQSVWKLGGCLCGVQQDSRQRCRCLEFDDKFTLHIQFDVVAWNLMSKMSSPHPTRSHPCVNIQIFLLDVAADLLLWYPLAETNEVAHLQFFMVLLLHDEGWCGSLSSAAFGLRFPLQAWRELSRVCEGKMKCVCV